MTRLVVITPRTRLALSTPATRVRITPALPSLVNAMAADAAESAAIAGVVEVAGAMVANDQAESAAIAGTVGAPESALVALWPLGMPPASDAPESVAANDLTQVGGVTQEVGRASALLLDGAQHLEHAYSSWDVPAEGEVTAWVYPEASGNQMRICYFGPNDLNRIDILRDDDDSLWAYSAVGGDIFNVQGGTIEQDEWSFIRVRWGTGGVWIYINETLVASSLSADYSRTLPVGSAYIGRKEVGKYWTGRIESVSLSGHLSQATIDKAFGNRCGCRWIDYDEAERAAFVHYWPLSMASDLGKDLAGSWDMVPYGDPVSAQGNIWGRVNARALDGTLDYFTSMAGDHDVYSVGDVDAVWEVWFKIDASMTLDRGLLHKWRSIQKEWRIMLDYNAQNGYRIQFKVRNPSDSGSATATGNYGLITPGRWHQLLAWHDATGDVIGMKLDGGDLVVNALVGGGFTHASNALDYGRDSGGSGVLGSLSVFRWWKGAGLQDLINDVNGEHDILWNDGSPYLEADLPLSIPARTRSFDANEYEGDLQEKTGSGEDFTVYGVPVPDVGPASAFSTGLDKALYQYLVRANAACADLQMGEDDTTVFGAVKLHTVPSAGENPAMFYFGGNTSGVAGYRLRIDPSQFHMGISNGSGTIVTRAVSTTHVVGQWMFLLVEFERSDQMRLFLDNIQIGQNNIDALLGEDIQSSIDFRVGYRANSDDYIDASLQLHGVVRRLLTTAEKKALYNYGQYLRNLAEVEAALAAS